MIQITNEKECCGCAACAAACPGKCIAMLPGTLGAMFPQVDLEKCMHCDSCETVCPMKKKLPNEGPFLQIAYAAHAVDHTTRRSGSSGGMFPVLAKKAIELGSVVFGAAFNQDLRLECTAATTAEELVPLLKSKYIQSDMQCRFEEIREILQKGERVFFTATPCQVAALKSFLGKEYDNLLTVDFFCHGVPSQDFFDRCKQYGERKHSCKITGFSFREKIKRGATPHYFKVTYQKRGKECSTTRLYFQSAFYAAFQKYITLRESCYNCRYAGQKRCSDITIGDFHTIDRYIKGIDRFEGVSTVIVNSCKGNDFLESCQDALWMQQVDLNLLQKNGDCFAGATIRPKDRDAFVSALACEPFERVIERYFAPRKYWKNNIYYHLPKRVRNVVRRFRFGD